MQVIDIGVFIQKLEQQKSLLLICSVETKEEQVLLKYLPHESISYCLMLWKTHRVQLTISKPRNSVYGNYSFRNGIHNISVNGNLNPQAFLVTYLHEVAHLMVRVKHKNRMRPHGPEWQDEFRKLLEPMYQEGIFEPEIRVALIEHMKKPCATSCSDPFLHSLLMKDDSDDQQGVPVSTLKPDQVFTFKNNIFKFLYPLRKRIACRNLINNKVYLFQPTARVEMSSDAFLQESEGSIKKLLHLAIGTRFKLMGTEYNLVEKRRTRFVCQEVNRGSLYLIHSEQNVDV